MKRVLFAAVIAVSSIAVPNTAQAAPAWANYAAGRICSYLERGFTPYKAGYEGMKDVLESNRHAGAAMRAYRQMGDRSSTLAATTAMQQCPEALIRSQRNTGI